MIKSALFILSGNAAMWILLLARNLIIARMIPVADYGIASTFAVVMAVVEMASSLGLHQQIVQSKDGDDPAFQAALQGFQVFRGVISGVVLFALAGPMASFMGVPEVTWGYQLLAVVPVLNALIHFDIHRMNRQMVFWPMLLTGAFPALLSVAAVWPLSHYMGDWRVLLYAILIQGVVGVVVSHLVAKRPYRLTYDAAVVKNSLRFGWPLLANAVLLFFVFNGERLIIGRELGMAELAIFSMGLTLTLTPTLIIAKSMNNFFLPHLSRTTEDTRFRFLATTALQLHIIFGGLLVVGAALLGSLFIHLVLGAKYADLATILTGLAVVQGLRILKGGPAIVSLSKGRTENSMISNMVRVAFLPVAWFFLQKNGQIELLIAIAVAAEALSVGVSFYLMSRHAPLAWGQVAATLILNLAAFALAFGADQTVHPLMWQLAAAALVGLSALILGLRIRSRKAA